MDGTCARAPYRAAAMATMAAEHRSLAEVLDPFLHLLKDIAMGHAEPDFGLLSTALCYIDDFACRCHHPKEELYVFPKIRRYVPGAAGDLDGLNAEHQRDYLMVKDLHRRLVHYQAGTQGGLGHLIDSVDVYTTMVRDHLRREEALFTACADAIPELEWAAIAAGFQREDDALFAPAPGKAFERLRATITHMLPTKLRRHAHDHCATEAC